MEIKYTPVANRAKTLFIDIDGVIFKQGKSWPDVYHDTQVLPGSKEKLVEWNLAGHKIILTTGRPECFRALTEKQLVDNFIPYNLLLMDLPTGQRVVLNDLKPEELDMPMAIAVNLVRDQGMAMVEF